MKRAIILPALVTAFVALSPAGIALADNPHDGTTGQPNKEASDNPALKPPGFSTGSGLPDTVGGATGTGFANAEQHYAGQPGTPTDPSDTHANGHAVSQYDVAGFQLCTHSGGTNC
jgi:hypothetical protein